MKRFTMQCWLVILGVIAVGVIAPAAYADVFGSGENAFEIEFVTIGDPGNVADTEGDPNPAGTVPYTYRIGKYEISEAMIDAANAITAGEGNPLGITLQGRGPNKPATLNWFEAAEFVNWLNTSKGATPAYNFDFGGEFQLWEPSDPGYDPDNKFRNSRALYFLPSVDEWYKAAFYDPVTDQWFDFPNGSNTAPLPVGSGTDPNTAVFLPSSIAGPADVMQAGGLSPFGTMAQGGNVDEWQETEFDLLNDGESSRIFRGGSWHSGEVPLASSRRRNSDPAIGNTIVGFRIASIPEPSTLVLSSLGILGVLGLTRYRETR